METTLEDLGRGGLMLRQPADRFRYGTDSVLLADFAARKHWKNAVDLGSGCGVIALLLIARRSVSHIDCVEIQEEMAELAEENIRINALEDLARSVHCDMRKAAPLLGYEKYDLAVSNPPYFDNAGPASADSGINTARHEAECSAVELCKAAFSLLRNGGHFCVVYPAARLSILFAAMAAGRIEPKWIRCVQDRPSKAGTLLLVEGVKNGGPGLEWLPPLFLHDECGNETDEYNRIYGIEKSTHL